MQVVDLPVDSLREAAWNPNQMDQDMSRRLAESVGRFGLVENLVVRPLAPKGHYEVLSGNQRLQLLRAQGEMTAPCVVVDLKDPDARLLAQALNRIQGEDDLDLKALVVQEILESRAPEDVLALLPETADSLRALSSLGQMTMSEYLEAWGMAQAARLKHLTFQLLPSQLEIVQEALERVTPRARVEKGESPNAKGTSLYLLCKAFLEGNGDS